MLTEQLNKEDAKFNSETKKLLTTYTPPNAPIFSNPPPLIPSLLVPSQLYPPFTPNFGGFGTNTPPLPWNTLTNQKNSQG